MNYLAKNSTVRPSFSLLNIFLQTKHQISLLSTFASQHENANPNEEPILATKYPIHSSETTHLVLTSNVTKSPPLVRREFGDIASSHRLITSHIRSGDLDSALKVFHDMKIKTAVTWNSILAGYAKKPGKVKDAQQLFDKIPDPDTFSYNTMLVCYLNNFGVTFAMEFFNNIPVKDTVTWNTMISGFSQEKKMRRAQELFNTMPEKNSVSWSAMVSGYVGSRDLESAAKLFDSAPVKSVVAWTAMINGYMKIGKIESAESLFAQMVEKNVVTWNAMIAGYVENLRPEEGLKIFRAMVVSGIEPNPSSLSSVLLGCSNLSALQMGKQVHSRVCKSPMRNDTTAATSIVSMYCKCGDLDDARRLFLEIRTKDTVTWNAMITGCAKHGAGQEALALFHSMRRGGTRPDRITFVAVLSACNHSGLVDSGVRYFESMVRDHGVGRGPEHYTCMVDLLGRAGRLSEAAELIKKMPFEPCAAVFGALLGACRLKKDWELAEYAAENLLRLDPSSAGAYVQLANVYASSGKWDRVSEVWRSMKRGKVVKEPGYSWIEVRSSVHEFRSGDRIHLEIASIREKLAELHKKMKLLGYVPDLDSALCNSNRCFQ